MTPDIDRVRSRSFGAVAASYDTHRPRYPDELVDDVAAMVPGRRLLEVGAGTGIATAAFVARGLAMTCVEPDPEMAAVLSAKFAGTADVRVAVATFEEWSTARPPGASRFDGLICAQAWHWTDPATRWPHAAAAIRPGGAIALFWNEDGHADPRVTEAFTAAYERHGVDLRAVQATPMSSSDPGRSEEWPEAHAEAAGYFVDLRSRRYHWTFRTSVADPGRLLAAWVAEATPRSSTAIRRSTRARSSNVPVSSRSRRQPPTSGSGGRSPR